MSNQTRNIVNMVARGVMDPSSLPTAAPLPLPAKPPGMTLAQMLGGNLFARQVADNSMSPLAMLQQFRATGQMPSNPGSNVMFGRMPMQQPMQGMSEMAPAPVQATNTKGLK